MSLYDKIKKNMVQAMKDRDKQTQSILKVLVSDINRDPNKDYSDEKVIAVTAKTVKILYDNHAKYGKSSDLIEAEYLEREYLPKQVNIDEVNSFLDTLDFTKFKNKMQAIGKVKQHFPKGSIDGNFLKDIVMNYTVN